MKTSSQLIEIGALDRMASGNTAVHQLDPRSKLLTTLLLIVVVMSFDKYEIARLIPYAVFPLVIARRADLPLRFFARRILWALPFVIFVALFNLIADRSVVMQFGNMPLHGGTLSFLSIMIRFFITVSAALVLLACTGIHNICLALDRFGVPRVFTVQLLFLYRYIFVLMEEAMHMSRARSMRAFGGRGMGMQIYANMLGSLLVRTIDRAQRIHTTMSCRGFDGQIRCMQQLKPSINNLLFVICWAAFFLTMRFINLPQMLGQLIGGAL